MGIFSRREEKGYGEVVIPGVTRVSAPVEQGTEVIETDWNRHFGFPSTLTLDEHGLAIDDGENDGDIDPEVVQKLASATPDQLIGDAIIYLAAAETTEDAELATMAMAYIALATYRQQHPSQNGNGI